MIDIHATKLDFLQGFKFDDFKIPPQQTTDPKSLADRGKRIKYTLVDNFKYLGKIVAYVMGVLATSAKHTALYGVISTIAILGALLITPTITTWLAITSSSDKFANYIVALILLFLIFVTLNIFRLLGTQYSFRSGLHAQVDDFVLWRPRFEFDKRLYYVLPTALHHGNLNVRYAYTEEAFFVLGGTHATATVIDLDYVRDVQDTSDYQWITKRGTNGLQISLGDGSSETTLFIHGSYFEDEHSSSNGNTFLQEFLNGLRANCRRLRVKSKSP